MVVHPVHAEEGNVGADVVLRTKVEENGQRIERIKSTERFLRRVVEDQESRLRRVEELGIETRAMIGEREMRVHDFLLRAQELARAYADGLQELIREW